MRLLLCILLLFGLSQPVCGYSKDLPQTWANEWASNLRTIAAWHMPYKWGGESKEEGGYDCTGFLYAGSPEIFRIHNRIKRSTSGRMEMGLDGWRNRPTDCASLGTLDLGFTDGHAFAIVLGNKSRLWQIIHSRSSKGPIEEQMPQWLWDKHPRFKRLTIGE